LLTAHCATTPAPKSIPKDPAIVLEGSDGSRYAVPSELGRHRFTVFVFYSEDCPCMRAHEPRLEKLRSEYASRGVAVLLVDSERGASPERDAVEAKRRGYVFPLLTDRDGRLAKALNAEFATHSIVVDPTGRVRYSGAIDSDKNHVRSSATPYLRQALDDLLAGNDPRTPDREPLGCALRLR
jgi:peroxiredoxin